MSVPAQQPSRRAQLLRTLSIIALVGFGIALLVPALGDRLEARLSTISPRLGVGSPRARRT